jgi:hypothetical protein
MVVFNRHSADVLRRWRAVAPIRLVLWTPTSERDRYEFNGRAEMNRKQSGARRRAYPDFGGQDRGIGLRAVAAAVRYQGDAGNAGRQPKQEVPVPDSVVTQSGDAEK